MLRWGSQNSKIDASQTVKLRKLTQGDGQSFTFELKMEIEEPGPNRRNKPLDNDVHQLTVKMMNMIVLTAKLKTLPSQLNRKEIKPTRSAEQVR